MDYIKIKPEDMLDRLKKILTSKRYTHSIGTAECAKELAKMYGLNEDKAYIAGLLHDCAKCFDTEKLLKIIEEHLDVNADEMLNYKTLHAPVSAYYAQKDFGVTDTEILSAIRWHTLGKLNMTLFEKIIFLADKIEPNTRDLKFCQKIFKMLKKTDGIDKALLKCYKETIKSLIKRDLRICPLTIEIYNELLGKECK